MVVKSMGCECNHLGLNLCCIIYSLYDLFSLFLTFLIYLKKFMKGYEGYKCSVYDIKSIQ